MTHMTPQARPLYAVGWWDDHVDLLLVVAWSPIDAHEALPVFVHINSTGEISAEWTARTMADLYKQISFYDDREAAQIAYESETNKLRMYQRRTAAARAVHEAEGKTA